MYEAYKFDCRCQYKSNNISYYLYTSFYSGEINEIESVQKKFYTYDFFEVK